MIMMVSLVLLALVASIQAFPPTLVIMDKQNQSIVSRTPARQFYMLTDSSNSFKSITAIRNITDVKSVVLISSSLCGSFVHSILSSIWKNRTVLCVGKFYYQPKEHGLLNKTKCCAKPKQQPQGRVSEIINSSTRIPIGSVLNDILHRSKWKSAIVFHDSLKDDVVTELTSGPLQTKLAMYLVGSRDNINDILAEAYTTEKEDKKNFLIIGSIRIIRRVLTSASTMDDRSTGIISLTSWIVVLPAAHRHVVEDISPLLDNVLVVSYPEIWDTSSWKVVSSLLCDTLEPARQNDTALTSQQNTISSPWNGTIHTLLYKDHGRLLSLVGQFDLMGDTHLNRELFPNLNTGFNGRLLTVSTKEYAPFVRILRNGSNVEFVGLCVDLLSNVAEALNFTYRLTEPPDGEWGTFQNDSWNGLIRQLQFKEVDMVLAPLTVREDREAVMDFTYPYFHDAAGAIFKRPGLRRWATLLKPFKWEVLVCLGTVVAGLTLLLYVMENERRKHIAKRQQRKEDDRVAEDSFWYIWGIFLKNGSHDQPMTISGRVLVSFLSLFCIVVSAAYSGNLIAFLTISRETVPFKTSQEMAEQSQYRWGTINGSLWQLQIANSNQSDFQKLWQGIRTFSESDPDVLAPFSKIHKKKVEGGNYVFFSDRSVMEIWARENCQLTLLEETFRQITYGIGLPNHSPYRDVFSNVLMKFEKAGLLSLLRRKWWPGDEHCEDNVKVNTRVVELEDLQSAFYVLLIGLFLAFLILVLENFRVIIVEMNKRLSLKMNIKQTTRFKS